MKPFRVVGMPNSSIIRIYSERKFIQLDPEYQRQSEVWTLEKRQLLIDSILNEFDIPKLYFHAFPKMKALPDGRKVRYAIIDGRQRLETIWGFIDGDFPLSEDFVFYEDMSIDAKGLTYPELARRFLDLKIRFDGYTLPIMEVTTDDVDTIEEMFVRLNEAVPMNAAEKRNAFGGPMAARIRMVSDHAFFTKKVPFLNRRYQHYDVSAKMLLLTHSQESDDPKRKVVDTKKAYLDHFVKDFKKNSRQTEAERISDTVWAVLTKMSKVFINKDPLLKTQAMCVVLFLAFLRCRQAIGKTTIERKQLLEFEEEREANRKVAQDDLAKAKYELLEFDRMSLQGSNDAASIRIRLETLEAFLRGAEE